MKRIAFGYPTVGSEPQNRSSSHTGTDKASRIRQALKWGDKKLPRRCRNSNPMEDDLVQGRVLGFPVQILGEE